MFLLLVQGPQSRSLALVAVMEVAGMRCVSSLLSVLE